MLPLPSAISAPPSPTAASTRPLGSVFRGVRLDLLEGTLFQPTDKCFAITVQLGVYRLRTGIIRLESESLNLGYTFLFPFAPKREEDEAFRIMAHLDGSRPENGLAEAWVRLSGARPDRRSFQHTVKLIHRDSFTKKDSEWAEIPIHVEMLFAEPSLRCFSLKSAALTYSVSAEVTAGTGRSSRNLSPTGRVLAHTPFKGLKVTVARGAAWELLKGRRCYASVQCGTQILECDENFKVDNEGRVVVNKAFFHPYRDQRLLHVSLLRDHNEPVGSAVCDLLFLIDSGVMSCKQYLSFYDNFGQVAGYAEIHTEFLVESPKPAVTDADDFIVAAQTAREKSRPDRREESPADSPPVKIEDENLKTYEDYKADQSSPPDLHKMPSKKSSSSGSKDSRGRRVVTTTREPRALLCGVWSLRDLPLRCNSCTLILRHGPHQLSNMFPIHDEAASLNLSIREIFEFPFEKDFPLLRLEVLLDCDWVPAGTLTGFVDIDFAKIGSTSLSELEIHTGDKYLGLVSFWIEPSRKRRVSQALATPFPAQWDEVKLPPSSLLLLAQEDAVPEVKRKTKPRPPICGPHENPYLNDEFDSTQLKKLYFQGLPPMQRCALTEVVPEVPIQSIEFQVHGLRRLPDLCGCRTMKLALFARHGNHCAVSSSLRVYTPDPDFDLCRFCLPFTGEQFLYLDVLEISVTPAPVNIGELIWDLSELVTSGQCQGILQLSGRSESYCLYSALASDQATRSHFEGLSKASEQTEIGREVLDTTPGDRSRRSMVASVSIPPVDIEQTSFMAFSRRCVRLCLISIDHLASNLPFEKQTLHVQLRYSGRTLQSTPIPVERLSRAPIHTSFRLPVLNEEARDLWIELVFFASTPVTDPVLVGETRLSLDARRNMERTSAPVQCSFTDHPAELHFSTELERRSLRSPLQEETTALLSPKGMRSPRRLIVA